MVGWPTYLGALFTNTCAIVNPARLVFGLARACAENGVEIYEHTAATSIHADRSGVRVGTEAGVISAARVVLATNVFPSLLRRNRLHTVPVYDYVLATEPLWAQAGVSLVMDIGTNTEISLVQHDGRDARIWSSSCPSGPALEGGHIASGMRAAEGAIERVAITDDRLTLQVIGAVQPIGLCGSGVLDALAAFVRAGWVDARGRIVGPVPEVGSVDGVKAITLAEESADVPAVRFTQHDVRAVQLAKSAIRTGVKLLAAEAGLDEARIDRFVIAGAFGAYISVESCVAIGLLPDLPRERFTQVGNAAGLGVQQMLASRTRRERAARLATDCRYVELSSRSDFQKTFLQRIGF